MATLVRVDEKANFVPIRLWFPFVSVRACVVFIADVAARKDGLTGGQVGEKKSFQLMLMYQGNHKNALVPINMAHMFNILINDLINKL